MRVHNASRKTPNRMESAFVGTDSRASEPRSLQLLNASASSGHHRSLVRRAREPLVLQNRMAELLADIEGLPILVRLLVQDVSAQARSDLAENDANLHSLLSSTLEKMVERMRGSPLPRDNPAKQPVAIVELISDGTPLAQLLALRKETVLRVGALELDLIDRTAKRSDRPIYLRPREFQLLEYMMQRSDKLLTRTSLLRDVWRYKFVPETNLVDVHMGRLRRKVDGPGEVSMIRNVRGVGFFLSATPFLQDSPPSPTERSTSGPLEATLPGRRKGVPLAADPCLACARGSCVLADKTQFSAVCALLTGSHGRGHPYSGCDQPPEDEQEA
jgi:DNA-binding winged helix-turn-helix (wHTH) protein